MSTLIYALLKFDDRVVHPPAGSDSGQNQTAKDDNRNADRDLVSRGVHSRKDFMSALVAASSAVEIL